MKSIIQSEDKQECCFICGQWATDLHHCLHGNGRRALADKDGLTVMLCRSCHMNLHDHGSFDRELQRIAQARWMEYYEKSESDFRKRYGKSYL
jgi:Zn-finger protein